ncbi:MAG TPA: PQQ-binding-like beta-propeller repeat protein, partial [Ktedonobacteraceae bacterium]
FYGPRQQAGSTADLGAMLARGGLVYWQVEGVVYALNPQTGQVEWRDAIPEVNAQMAPLEEGQMATGLGVLLIRRSDMYHALDLVMGAERWTLSGLGVDSAQTPGGILADGNKFILYGGGSIEAFDPAAHSVLWKHDDLVAVSNVSLSPDGSIVYAVVFNNVDGGTNTQALVAFDANSDLIHWTFQPDAQAQFVYAGARIIYNAGGMIYLATCVASGPGTCIRQVLYGVDENTGKARWQIAARRISALQASQDGQTLTFQTDSSAWESLKALFRG